MSHTADRPAAAPARGATLGAALIIGSLVPLVPGQAVLPSLPLGLLIAAVTLLALVIAVAAVAVAPGERGALPARLEASALWAACALAALYAAAGIATVAETLDLENIVLAQRNTALHVIRQPVAAWIFVVAVTMAGHESALDALLGPPSRGRALALGAMLLALSALGATLFLGGFDGRRLPPPAWLALKTLVIAALVLLLRARLRGLTLRARLAIAWAAGLAGLINLVVALTLAVQ